MTSPLLATSDAEDAAAVDAIRSHHAHLEGELVARATAALVEALSAASPATAPGPARTTLVRFCRTELLPHAAAEEATLYPLAQADPQARLLVEGMVAEHSSITTLVDELESAGTAVEAAARASALRVVFELHLAKENDLVLPLLAASPTVSLAGALAGMHELLGAGGAVTAGAGGTTDAAGKQATGEPVAEPAAPADGCGGACGCGGGGEEPAEPVLDVREFPHSLRHGVVFGALDAVAAGGALVLLAPHDPLPLLHQLEERRPRVFEVQYLERGPQVWRLRLARA